MKKGKMQHMHIEPNDNGGAQVKVHRAPMMHANAGSVPLGGGPMPSAMMGNQDENLGAATPEEAGAHVTRLLKEHQGQAGGKDEMPASPLKSAFGRSKKKSY